MAATSTSDEALYAAFLAGDRRAARELFGRYAVRLRAWARRAGVPECDIDDAVAAVWLCLVAPHSPYDPTRGSKFSTWLYRVARNVMIDFRRREASPRRLETELPEDELAAAGDPTTILETAERRQRIQEALDGLKPADREILAILGLGTEEEGLSLRGAMKVLGITFHEAQTRRVRALSVLGRVLKAMGVAALAWLFGRGRASAQSRRTRSVVLSATATAVVLLLAFTLLYQAARSTADRTTATQTVGEPALGSPVQGSPPRSPLVLDNGASGAGRSARDQAQIESLWTGLNGARLVIPNSPELGMWGTLSVRSGALTVRVERRPGLYDPTIAIGVAMKNDLPVPSEPFPHRATSDECVVDESCEGVRRDRAFVLVCRGSATCTHHTDGTAFHEDTLASLWVGLLVGDDDLAGYAWNEHMGGTFSVVPLRRAADGCIWRQPYALPIIPARLASYVCDGAGGNGPCEYGPFEEHVPVQGRALYSTTGGSNLFPITSQPQPPSDGWSCPPNIAPPSVAAEFPVELRSAYRVPGPPPLGPFP